MNKKFFAALASATMAFTASGSIAVFADDFVEEKNPVINNGELAPKPTKVLWNEDNFGALATEDNKVNTAVTGLNAVDPDEKGYVLTSKLESVTSITLGADFKGEIKGLEYFTGLTSFDDTAVTSEEKVTNKALDFSANTKLGTLKVNNAKGLTEIVLPKAFVEKDKKETYKLATLDLQNTKLTALDLSAQEALTDVTVSNNGNLAKVTFHAVTKSDKKAFTKLDLSHNALETVNLDNYTVTNLDLSYNHIGALDLRDATVTPVSNGLKNQTFYVSELLANVNLTETFPELDVNKVTKVGNAVFDEKTGVLTLDSGKSTTYKYAVDGTNQLEVTLTAANPMNRLYNPNSGEHFYTADIKEKEALVALGWQDEGYGWVAPSEKDTAAKDKPVFRLYNPNAGDHHYTTDDKEVKTLVAYGWKDEGTGWYSAKGSTKVEVYRQYNPYANGAGSHNYTTDKAENDYLVSLGWTPEGTAWFALQ